MKVRLKPLHDQVIVITGASSGIGLTTARMAVRSGARVVLNSRNDEALNKLEQEFNEGAVRAAHVTGDVANPDDMRRLADAAVERFGHFDTWINNAGVSVYGRIEQVSMEDHRRLFETNFWGVVNGSVAALPHLKSNGGALINIGSTLSDRAIPIQGMYSASKFAVRGFTDALRMELEEEGAPVSVTLIKPAAINTPYPEHAKNYMDRAATLPPPVYEPETVARAILHAAVHPERDLSVGSASKMFQLMEKYAPRTTDRVMERMLVGMQLADRPRRDAPDGLHHHGEPLKQYGDYEGHVSKTSAYTQAAMHPLVTTAVIGAAGLAIAGLLAAAPSSRRR